MPNYSMEFTPDIVEDASGREYINLDGGTVKFGQGRQQVVQEHNSEPEAIIEVEEDDEGNTESYVEMDESDISVIHDMVGGEELYDEMIAWAARSLTEEEISEFDEVIESGDIAQVAKYTKMLYDNYNNRQVDSNDEFINETIGREAYNQLMEIIEDEFDAESKQMVIEALETRDLDHINAMLESVAEQMEGDEE